MASRVGRTPRPVCRNAVRRTAADARDRPWACLLSETSDAGRAVDGVGADPRRSHFRPADRNPPANQTDQPSGRAARGRSAGVSRPRLCAGSRSRGARRRQADASRGLPRPAGLPGNVEILECKKTDENFGRITMKNKTSKGLVTRRTVLSGAAAIGLSGVARAQAPAEVKVGLIVPMAGISTRTGPVL